MAVQKLIDTSFQFLKTTFLEWKGKNPHIMAAAISFYVVFSMGPILVIIIGLVGFIFGKQAAEGQIVEEIQSVVGQKAAQVIQKFIEKAYTPPEKNITAIISIPLIFFGATMIFFQLRNALNMIWEVETKKEKGILNIIKNYLFSFSMVLVVGFLLLLLTLKSPILAFLESSAQEIFPIPGYLMRFLDFFISFLIVTFLFAIIYEVLPDLEIKWFDVLIGAAVTSLMFTIVQILVGVYITQTDIGTAYGAIGSITILFIWIFYSALVFLLGAVFTRQYTIQFGSLASSKRKGKRKK